MHKAYAETRFGQIHYAESGAGEPVLFLHQTPRSWDEYRDVLPILAPKYRAIAMDTLGFGASSGYDCIWSIELFADAVEGFLADMKIESVSLVGHHTGGVIAMEVAARNPSLVKNLVLSGVPYVDEDRRKYVAGRPPIDGVEPKADGSHLLDLWNRRTDFYPMDRPDLITRLVQDAVRVIDRVEEGHVAVNSCLMEERIGRVQARTMIVCGELDSFSLPDVPKLQNRIAGSVTEILPNTGVSSVDHSPEQFARAVIRFLDSDACHTP